MKTARRPGLTTFTFAGALAILAVTGPVRPARADSALKGAVRETAWIDRALADLNGPAGCRASTSVTRPRCREVVRSECFSRPPIALLRPANLTEIFRRHSRSQLVERIRRGRPLDSTLATHPTARDGRFIPDENYVAYLREVEEAYLREAGLSPRDLQEEIANVRELAQSSIRLRGDLSEADRRRALEAARHITIRLPGDLARTEAGRRELVDTCGPHGDQFNAWATDRMNDTPAGSVILCPALIAFRAEGTGSALETFGTTLAWAISHEIGHLITDRRQNADVNARLRYLRQASCLRERTGAATTPEADREFLADSFGSRALSLSVRRGRGTQHLDGFFSLLCRADGDTHGQGEDRLTAMVEQSPELQTLLECRPTLGLERCAFAP